MGVFYSRNRTLSVLYIQKDMEQRGFMTGGFLKRSLLYGGILILFEAPISFVDNVELGEEGLRSLHFEKWDMLSALVATR
jgi:hypothetical protein